MSPCHPATVTITYRSTGGGGVAPTFHSDLCVNSRPKQSFSSFENITLTLWRQILLLGPPLGFCGLYRWRATNNMEEWGAWVEGVWWLRPETPNDPRSVTEDVGVLFYFSHVIPLVRSLTVSCRITFSTVSIFGLVELQGLSQSLKFFVQNFHQRQPGVEAGQLVING